MIKDDNKLVLLTIFLYITLNLRKVENLIQCVNNKESFTFSKESNINKNMLALTIAKICFILICVILVYFFANVDSILRLLLADMNGLIKFMFFILACVLIMAIFALTSIIDDGWAQSLDVITNEISYGLSIYFILSNLLLNQVYLNLKDGGPDQSLALDIKKFMGDQRKKEKAAADATAPDRL